MDAIVRGLNLTEYPFEKYEPQLVKTENPANIEDRTNRDVLDGHCEVGICIPTSHVYKPEVMDVPIKELKLTQAPFEKIEPQILQTPESNVAVVEERMHGYVLEHRHPGYYYWHPKLRLHKIEPVYLFSWDGGFGNDSTNLIYFLKQKFGIDHSSYRYIKSDDGRTIRLSFKNNSLSLILNDAKTNVTLKIDDVRMDEFVVVNESGRLNIYLPSFEKEEHQVIQTSESHDANIEERIFGDVLEHRHPEYYYWHPVLRIHPKRD